VGGFIGGNCPVFFLVTFAGKNKEKTREIIKIKTKKAKNFLIKLL